MAYEKGWALICPNEEEYKSEWMTLYKAALGYLLWMESQHIFRICNAIYPTKFKVFIISDIVLNI